MSLNWKEIENSVSEMRTRIAGGMVQKIWTAADPAYTDCIFFSGYSYGKGAWSFAIVLSHDIAGIFSLDKKRRIRAAINPQSYVMLLRKKFLNKSIKAVDQIDGERVLLLKFPDDLLLLAELMPRKSNLFIIQTTIQAAYRKSNEYENCKYVPPVKGNFSVGTVREFSEIEGGIYWDRYSEFFWHKIAESAVNNERKAFLSAVEAAIKKTKKSTVKLESELKKSKDSVSIKEQADTLFASLYEIGAKMTPSDTELMLPHYEDGRLVKVRVDKKYTYSENANRLFDKYKKLLRTEKEASERLASTNEYCFKLESAKEMIKSTESLEELQGISPMLVDLGLKKISGALKKKKHREQSKAKPFIEIISSDEFVMLVGRNKEENRRVTFKSAVGSDTWLHVKGVPGAHCIIKRKKSKTIPLSTLLEASQLVAYYSKVKNGTKVEVDYAFKKHVRSQKGSISEVTYTDYRTLYIESDHQIVRNIMRKNSI